MYEINLLYKVTWYYYIDNMTQQEIAEHLGISRMKVVKLLNQAKTEGIVKFQINHNAKNRIDLEQSLMNKFNLDDIFIVPSTLDNCNENIAKGAAQYLEDKIEPNSYINIGYGDTISRTINHLIYSLEKPVSFVTLSGGVSYYTSALISGAHMKAAATNTTPQIHILPAPLIASSEEVAKIFLKEQGIMNILNMTKLSSMSIVGIGSVSENATIFKYNIANSEDLVLLKMKGAVGDILSQFFDKNGNIIETEMHKKLVSINIANLKNTSKTIGVAGGKDKIQSIYSALIGGYLNVLITDENTANSLLTYNNC